jgi:hypothetical protein
MIDSDCELDPVRYELDDETVAVEIAPALSQDLGLDPPIQGGVLMFIPRSLLVLE